MSLIEGLQNQMQQVIANVTQLRRDVDDLRAQVTALSETRATGAGATRSTSTSSSATQAPKTGTGKN